MKIISLLSHSIAQVVSFSILLVGSPYFGGPYIFFLYHAFPEGYTFAITGIIGIVVTLISLFIKAGGYMQLLGAILMTVSLVIFFFSPRGTINASTFYDVVPIITLVLLATVLVMVFRKTLQQINIK